MAGHHKVSTPHAPCGIFQGRPDGSRHGTAIHGRQQMNTLRKRVQDCTLYDRQEPATCVEDLLDAMELDRSQMFENQAKKTAKFVRSLARRANLEEASA
jgi:bifunctional ADP-heptose synthase (sugar kinase/adenylyltransferase)